MSSPTRCPICHTTLVPGNTIGCAGCWTTRPARKGMSPTGFFIFSTLWLGLACALALVCAKSALYPWVAEAGPPDYAFKVLALRPAPPRVACRVETIIAPAQVATTQATGACSADGTPLPQAPAAPVAAWQRHAAGVLHSALSIGLGLLLSWALHRLLRRMFRQRAAPLLVLRGADS